MIFNGIVGLLVTLFNWILGFFPIANIDAVVAISSSLQNLVNPIFGFNWIFPSETFILYLFLLIQLSALVMLVKLTRWILSILTGGLFK